jgi:hypothetical protein
MNVALGRRQTEAAVISLMASSEHSVSPSRHLIFHCSTDANSFIHSSVALQASVRPRPLFQFLDPIHSGTTAWTGISPSQGPYLHTEQQKDRINRHRHPCLEWDSNPRSQWLSERKQFMPQTARPLRLVLMLVRQYKRLLYSLCSILPSTLHRNKDRVLLYFQMVRCRKVALSFLSQNKPIIRERVWLWQRQTCTL